jgi:hypothetical protein
MKGSNAESQRAETYYRIHSRFEFQVGIQTSQSKTLVNDEIEYYFS